MTAHMPPYLGRYPDEDRDDTYRYGDIEEYDNLLADLADAAEMAEEVLGNLADLDAEDVAYIGLPEEAADA